MAHNPRKYIVGVDVGTHSLGTAAIEIDDDGVPIQILGARVLVHDSGLDPAGIKTATTRLASSGVARRTRRMLRRRRKRLVELDHLLASWNWPAAGKDDDPYAPWKARAELAATFVENEDERHRLLGMAVRHIARHRGWRNPYARPEALRSPAEPSEFLVALRDRIETHLGRSLPADATPGQLVAATGLLGVRLRGNDGLLGARLHQADSATELHRIASLQGISSPQRDQLTDLVFKAESPKGAQAARIGRDPLPGQHAKPRATKASDAFQRYRIVSVLANLRVGRGSNERTLTPAERKDVLDFLLNVKPSKEPTWYDVAEVLKIDRSNLHGTAKETADGERSAARAPVHVTDQTLRTSRVSTLASWWPGASIAAREALVEALSNSAFTSESTADAVEAEELLHSLSEDDLAKLDSLHLPAGRAAYSADSLRRLTKRMLDDGVDLHEARIAEFDVAPDWTPPADPIGKPVGNPAVDRVLKATARWLAAAEAEWGAPERITVEHIRSAFMSEDAARAYDRENNNRAKKRRERVAEVQQQLNVNGELRRSDVLRFEALTRQNCQCLYCGDTVTFATAEMDHIVPRAGQGSTNNQFNLAVVCSRCNRAKSNTPFAVWAESCGIEGVSIQEAVERTRHWSSAPGESNKQFDQFRREVRYRLTKTEADPEIDARSLESVAWMANELAHRIRQHFKTSLTEVPVTVYRGALTAEARKASGVEGSIPLIGGRGKDRLDRRHHAVDAAVVALLEPSVARTLSERLSLRDEQRIRRAPENWKGYQGNGAAAVERFAHWRRRMGALSDALTTAFERDEIAVVENLRLRLGSGAAHDDTVRKFDRAPLSAAMPIELIDRAGSPALWTALTRLPDFDPTDGLPANSDRRVRVNGTHVAPDEPIDFLGGKSAAISVRGGYAEIGSTIHHARIYRVEGKKPSYAMFRVFTVDLLPHRHDDLFTAEIPARSISARTAEPKLRQALAHGSASYLGWVVTGDELEVDMSSFATGQVGEFMAVYPSATRWRLDGFFSASRLRLRPVLLAAEGIPEGSPDFVEKVLNRPGWVPAVNVVFGAGAAKVNRRDALGRLRRSSSAGLPVGWSADPRNT